MKMKIIGHIRTDFSTKFGLPRQSGLVGEIKGKIVFEKEYRVAEAFRGLSDFSHIWILWDFSKAHTEKWSPTVRPPLLGGNKRMGVFSTRSPFRPNPIGLSAVRLEKIEFTKDLGPVLYVSGVDIMDNTPIYDIKPYLAYADSYPEAIGGFTASLEKREVEVVFEKELLSKIPLTKREELIGALKCDPRPSYIDDKDRVYGFAFADFEIRFTACDSVLTVISVD